MALIGYCLLAASMVLVLRQMNAAAAGLLTAAFGVLMAGFLLPQIKSLIDTVHGFLASLGMDAQYYRIMLKTMGIALTTQIAMQVCQDLDAPSIARRAEFCGRVALMSVAVPVFVQLTQMAVGALR
ncbi:MAG: hypothetical protein IKK34_04285 [Clostridia bacterium]|nr:hypothetical protein [Clostridia bacterium]